jgi:hypothetical protein
MRRTILSSGFIGRNSKEGSKPCGKKYRLGLGS